MRKNRTLSLKRETLTELSIEQMTGVAGGSHACGATNVCTHLSVDSPCPSNPVTACVDLTKPGSLPCL